MPGLLGHHFPIGQTARAVGGTGCTVERNSVTGMRQTHRPQGALRLLASCTAAILVMTGVASASAFGQSSARPMDGEDTSENQAEVVAGQLEETSPATLAENTTSTSEVAVGADNGDTNVEIPVDPAAQISVEADSGTTINIGIPGAASANDAVVADDGTVVYTEALPDTDIAAQALANGDVRALISIAGPDAPSQFAFPVDIPGEGGLTLNDDGSADVWDEDGTTVAVVASPWAVDADGSAVETHFVLDGQTLVQVVDHEGASYPVVADPSFQFYCGDVMCALRFSRAGDRPMVVPYGDPVPLHILTAAAKAQYRGQGYTGQGIDVALIDSGVTPVAGLDAPGKILYGPDLSNEGGQPNLRNLDTFGHGTHLAGIIAGKDGLWVGGIARNSRIVSIKVAGATGETDVAQIIAGIDWVVEHKNDPGINIRVLNLSFGFTPQPGAGDALSAAVERAWLAGIVVVAAAGNRGNDHELDSPAISPYVIAVGAIEMYDVLGLQDSMTAWSSGGGPNRQPDVVAAGRSIVSYRVPGSMLDQLHPEAVVGNRYFRGSGTSQSAAVVSGWVAALLSRRPTLTPDQVKFLLTDRAVDVAIGSTIDGAGKINPRAVASDPTRDQRQLDECDAGRLKNCPVRFAPVQSYPPAIPAEGINGLMPPSGASWSGGSWDGASWSGGTWSGASWSGASWSGASWSSGTWSGASWSSASWSGASWSGASWSGASWSGASWSGASWCGASWLGELWS